jgi:hypothetical protein
MSWQAKEGTWWLNINKESPSHNSYYYVVTYNGVVQNNMLYDIITFHPNPQIEVTYFDSVILGNETSFASYTPSTRDFRKACRAVFEAMT